MYANEVSLGSQQFSAGESTRLGLQLWLKHLCITRAGSLVYRWTRVFALQCSDALQLLNSQVYCVLMCLTVPVLYQDGGCL